MDNNYRVHRHVKLKYVKTGIIIIGAGISGLSAARTLTNQGYHDYIILEGQNNPGGRIKTHYLDKHTSIELGAQWIHGTDNDLYKLAYHHNLISKDTFEEAQGNFMRTDGTILDPVLVNDVNAKIKQILEDCEKFQTATKYPKSMGDFLKMKFMEWVNTDLDEIRKRKLELLDWHTRFQIIDNACDNLQDVSAKLWGTYSSSQDHIILKQGYSSLINILVNDISGSIKLSHNVQNIEWNRSGNEVLVECENGRRFKADFIICTISLGLLQTHRGLFTPQLPEIVLQTVNVMGFGGINKIYLFFETKWWNAAGFQLIWSNEDRWETEWLRWISGFDDVGGNILVGWIGGIGAKIVEGVEEEIIGKECIQLLRRFTGDKKIPLPSRTIRTKWISNKFTCGSYSYVSNECDSQINFSAKNLTKPVLNQNNVPVMLFAGEACHPSHYSTTHGAFESGQEQANLALQILHQVKDSKSD